MLQQTITAMGRMPLSMAGMTVRGRQQQGRELATRGAHLCRRQAAAFLSVQENNATWPHCSQDSACIQQCPLQAPLRCALCGLGSMEMRACLVSLCCQPRGYAGGQRVIQCACWQEERQPSPCLPRTGALTPVRREC